MSLEIFKEQIKRFLSSDAPEVMAIKGAWGVGKTFSWNKFLTEARDQNQILIERYSYVSLFGVDSLDELKYLIFQQVVHKDLIGTEPNIESFKSNANKLIESLGRKSWHLFQDVPLIKNFSPAINSLSFLSLQNTLICIDDFERKGKNLCPRDVMGLISVLKEQKQCKVVLILNDESFEEDAQKEYKKYREKVIDFELIFDPDSKECADIALNDEVDSEKGLKEFIIALGINNIRIIKKTQRLSELVVPLTSQLEDEIKCQTFQSLTLFSWCFYASNDISPDLEYVKKIGKRLYGLSNNEKTSEQEKQWNAILQDYNFTNIDELDLVIAEAVEAGYVNESRFLEMAKKLNDQILATKSEGSFKEAWDLYHNSFDDNQDAVIKGIYESFIKNVKYITPVNLDATVCLFRSLGSDDLADKIISFYIKERKDEIGLFDLDKYSSLGHIKDSKVIDEFNAIHNLNFNRKSLGEVIAEISRKDGWDNSEIGVLASATVEDYYKIFKMERGEHLSSYVNACLKFRNISNPTEEHNKIIKTATEALKKIGEESDVNKLRINKFGI